MNQFAEQAANLAKMVSNLPVTGDEIAAKLAPMLTSAFHVELPEAQIKSYFESRGFHVESLASATDLKNGTNSDLIVLTYKTTINSSDPLSVASAGDLGKASGVHFHLEGDLKVSPELTFMAKFGLDHDGRFFIQEGSNASASIVVDGRLDGNAVIPHLTDVHAHAAAPDGKHLLDAHIDFLFSDFDQVADERLYLTGDGGMSISDILKHDESLEFTGTMDLEATLSVDSPVNQLPGFIRDHISGLLPSELSWTADVTYNLETGELDYEIENSSLTQVVDLFAQYGNIEDAVFQVMIDQISQHNPLPESVQKLLGTDLPVIGMNLMDLLDIPEAMQFLITPEAFKGKSLSDVESTADGNRLDFNLDLFKPENIRRMLSGETYDIFNVDIAQKFQKEIAAITVLPETTLFSYCGIVNVTAQIDLLPHLYFAFDVVMGLDSDGFYTVGQTRDAEGNLADQSAHPNIEFGGGITGRIIAEGDLCVVIDFVRITIDVGITAFGGFTFVSPNGSDPKMRNAEVLDPDNIEVTAGIDLNLGLKGELGILDMGLQAEVEELKTIELYRHSGGTLSDIQKNLASFKEKLQNEADGLAFNMVEEAVDQALAEVNQWAEKSTQQVTSWASDQATTITTWVNTQTDSLEAWTQQQMTNVNNWANSRMTDITKAASAQIESLNQLLNSQLGNINAWLDSSINNVTKRMASPVRDIINNATKQMRQQADAVRDSVTKQVRNAQATVASWAKQASNQVLQVAQKTQREVTSQIEKAMDTLSERGVALARNVINASTEQLTKAIESQTKALLQVVGTADELVREITAASQETTRDIAEIAKEKITEMHEELQDAKEDADKILKEKFDAAKQATERGLNEVKGTVTAELNKAKSSVEQSVQKLTNEVNKTVNEAGQKARDLTNNVKSSISRATNEFKDKVQSVATNALKEVTKVEQAIKAAAEKAAQAAREAAAQAAKAAAKAVAEAAAKAAAAKAAAEKAAQAARDAAAKAAAAAKKVIKKLRF